MNRYKISYLLATNNNLSSSKDTINSIKNLPFHEYEIIICCPENCINLFIANSKIVVDNKCTGSIYAFNKAYLNSNGNYISIIIDDIILPLNFLSIIDFMKSYFIQNKKYKISNILWDGGPGLYTYGHDSHQDGMSCWPKNTGHPVNTKLCPYSVIPLPFFERDTLENKLNNMIFHPYFKNHYCDHWLGFFLSKNEIYNPYNWRCPSIKYSVNKITRKLNTSADEYDSVILKKLTDNFIKNQTKYIYLY